MDTRKIQELIKIVEESGIAELEVHFFGGRKVIIRKKLSQSEFPHSATHISHPVHTPMPLMSQSATVSAQEPISEATEKTAPAEEEKYFKVVSPMVGTFYRKPSPDSQPYVDVGTHVVQGQTLCLIEAMKLFNEVKSEVNGTVRKILVSDNIPVEYGQVLFLIEPD